MKLPTLRKAFVKPLFHFLSFILHIFAIKKSPGEETFSSVPILFNIIQLLHGNSEATFLTFCSDLSDLCLNIPGDTWNDYHLSWKRDNFALCHRNAVVDVPENGMLQHRNGVDFRPEGILDNKLRAGSNSKFFKTIMLQSTNGFQSPSRVIKILPQSWLSIFPEELLTFTFLDCQT